MTAGGNEGEVRNSIPPTRDETQKEGVPFLRQGEDQVERLLLTKTAKFPFWENEESR